MDVMNQKEVPPVKLITVTLASGKRITYSHHVDKVTSWGVTDTGNFFISDDDGNVIVAVNPMSWEMFEVEYATP